eukprot:4032738-Alexandrium_andersonii.AAC.1
MGGREKTTYCHMTRGTGDPAGVPTHEVWRGHRGRVRATPRGTSTGGHGSADAQSMTTKAQQRLNPLSAL